MFLLKIKDRNGTPLKIGDIVALSDGKALKFFAEVQWMEKEQKLSPFHTFSFHSVIKVDEIPEHAALSGETRFKCWYTHSPEEDKTAELFNHYLIEWRKCEKLLENCYDITPVKK